MKFSVREIGGVCLLLLVGTALLYSWLRQPAQPTGQVEPSVLTEVAVRTGTIELADVRTYATAYGAVEVAPPGAGLPGGGARLAAPVAGLLTGVLASEGQPVQAGAILFQLDDRVVNAEATRAAEAVRFAELTVARQRQLLPAGGASERSLQQAETTLAARQGELAAAKVQQELRRVRAPFAGTVTRIRVQPGESVQASTALADIENADRLMATVGVPAAELGAVRLRARAEISSAGVLIGNGQVVYVSLQVDPANGLGIVRVSLPPDSELHRGQFVRVRIVTTTHLQALTVPSDSVVRTSDGGCEIALVEGDMARRRRVVCGIRDGDTVEIEGEGLRDGMPVVIAGTYGLPTESRIRVIGS